jgi:phenylalanyl-tRNA synthetase beta chain
VKLPLGWLREHVDPGLDPDALAERLRATGTWVEGVHRTGAPAEGGNLESFRVGRVLAREQHPNADRLSVCRVDLGTGEPRTIVCGAPNVAAGQTVAVALPGAVLPGGRPPLGVARLRGVESNGMILSEAELELGADGGGIMVLPDDLVPGAPLAAHLPLSDVVLECEITPNRPDCLSVLGLAREVSAITGAPLRPPDESEPPATGPGRVEDHVGLRVEAPELCPRYMARVFTDVTVGPSPPWLRARLAAAGMRSISNVVDVTNYVMLLVGQPLHAFDLDLVAGPEIVVRRAREGEPIVTLDGVERILDPSVLAICDRDRPAVIAGVFGAETAEVREGTTRVLLEAATFDGPSIMRTELALGLRTESSSRFEKGLPVELAARGMVLASRLLVELAGARLVPGTLDALVPQPPRPPVRMRHARASALLGTPIAPEEAEASLRRLGFGVRAEDGVIEADVPPERGRDVTREADLIEEVGRLHGIDEIPAELPRVPTQGARTPRQRLIARLGRMAADLGLSETIGLRLVPEADSDRLRLARDDPRRDVVRLENPMSEEGAVLRGSVLPGLLRAAAHNQAHQRPAGALFEIGPTFLARADGMADERWWFVGLLFGAPARESWRAEPPPVDLYAATGLAAALARAARVDAVPAPGADRPYGHPARQARLTAGAGGPVVGWAGEIHPLVLRTFDVRGPAAALAIDVDLLLAADPGPPGFRDLLSHPASTRDLSLMVDEGVLAADLVGVARRAGAPLVREARVVDRYTGGQVAAGKVSVLLRLVIADPERTLTDAEIDGAVEAALAALRERLGAERRG